MKFSQPLNKNLHQTLIKFLLTNFKELFGYETIMKVSQKRKFESLNEKMIFDLRLF